MTPRSTKCGHVFCWPCLEHYLSESQHSWAKCPICMESIYAAALKSVYFLETTLYGNAKISEPCIIDFTLMKRNTVSFC
jgi:hypothetical protein